MIAITSNNSSVYAVIGIMAMIAFTPIEAFQLPASSSTISTNVVERNGRERLTNNLPFHLSTRSNASIKSSTSLNAFDLLSDIDSFYQTAPYTSAFVTCGIKASAADLLAQFRSSNDDGEDDKDQVPNKATASDDKQQQNMEHNLLTVFSKLSYAFSTPATTVQKEVIDPNSLTINNQIEYQRNLAFILYGGLYQGIAQEYIYNYLFPMWFGTGNDIMTVLTKVSFDLLIISPFICIPIAYIVKSVIYNQTLMDGIQKYIYDLKYKKLLLTYYSIWFPAGLCSFGLVPDHLRIAFIAFVSFFWLIILSTVSSSKEEE
jgi:hypothetical protein